jgi:hypothetical protein
MTNNGIASFKILDPSAYLFDPACVFVSQDVGQFHVHFLPPNTLDHMEIGAANAGAANPNNYVRLLFYFWIWHLLPGHEFRIRKSSVILMKYGGFHDWRGSEALSREKAWAVEDSGVSSIRGG